MQTAHLPCFYGVRLAIILASCVLATVCSASADLIGPAPYLGAADSPFAGEVFDYFHLETFEDGAFNTPGASANAGWIVLGPTALTDSVDADDGAVDTSGRQGHSLFSNNEQNVLTITFDRFVLGELPTHAGVVWTDVGGTSTVLGAGEVFFTAVDENGVSLGPFGLFVLGDGSIDGGTTEDRFFGITSPTGISSISLAMPDSADWEVDHVQYGRAAPPQVPEPAGWPALVLAFSVLTLVRIATRAASA